MGFIDRFRRADGQREQAEAPDGTSRPLPEPRDAAPEPIEVVEVSTSEFHSELENGTELLVVDVREPWDFQAMHIPGAVSIPLSRLPFRYGELPPEKNIVLYCYHGFTSQDGAAFLMQRGYGRVRSLIGGFTQWAAEGRPTTNE